MPSQSISRRTFLKTSAATTAVLTTITRSNLLAGEGYGGNKIPIAVQLYSVRKECAQDLPGTFTALAKMGYKGVEFADYFGRDAKTLRQMLADHGLQCVGSHIRPFDSLVGDNLPKTIDFNQSEIGLQLLFGASRQPNDTSVSVTQLLHYPRRFNPLFAYNHSRGTSSESAPGQFSPPNPSSASAI